MNFISNIKSQPVQIKLFLLLILLRPLIDIFWWLKEINPFFSPLNWIGVISILLIVFYLARSASQSKIKLFAQKNILFFLIFGFLVIINAGGLILKSVIGYHQSTVQALGISLQLVSFPLFFLFVYQFIDDKNFDFILKCFLISASFPFAMILFELLFGPIDSYTPGGRHYERYRGLYPDGINYTIYWMIGLISAAYFYLKLNTKFTFYIILFTFVLISISLFYLNQAVAYFIFSFLFVTILIFVFRKDKKHFLTLTLALTLVIAVLYIPGSEKLSTLFQVDKEVIEGKLDIVHGANGRVWIWVEALNKLKELPVHSWLFGTGLSNTESFNYMTGGAHNDYLRILFTTGIAGLILYLLFIFGLFKGIGKQASQYKFLLISTIGSLLLFSVTHTPTFYISFVYFLTSVIAFYGRKNYEF